jgi:hypothetical protein
LSEDKFRQRTAKHPQLEEALTLLVIQTTVEKAGTVNDAVALMKAQELGELLGIRDFSYSKGWLLNWKKRSGLKCHKQHGEARSADAAGVERARRDLNKLLALYPPSRRYNYDEIGLFYKQQPIKTLARSAMPGRKMLKDRITVGLTCNRDGSDMLKPVIVHKSYRPRVFKAKKFKVDDVCHWFANKSAWVTAGMFKEMMRIWNRRFHDRRVVMLMDNAPVHMGFEKMQKKGFDFSSFLTCWWCSCQPTLLHTCSRLTKE